MHGTYVHQRRSRDKGNEKLKSKRKGKGEEFKKQDKLKALNRIEEIHLNMSAFTMNTNGLMSTGKRQNLPAELEF